METKILQIFYGNDAIPYKDIERSVPFPNAGSGFQGASNTTKIRFYFDRLGDTNTTWTAISKLPNGKLGSKILENSFDTTLNENYCELELSSFYTQYKGDVLISLQGYQGGIQFSKDETTGIYTIVGTPTILTTASVKIYINYATQFIGSGEEENVDLQSIMSAMGGKLNIKDGILVLNTLPQASDYDNYENGQIIYVKDTNKFYKFTNGEPIEYIIFNPEGFVTVEQSDFTIPPEER